MKLLLVDNLLFEGGLLAPRFDLQPHLGLMSLVAVAHAARHEAIIFDPKWCLARGLLTLDARLYTRLAAQIANLDADAVGFTALGCNIHCVLQTAHELKKLRPRRPILIGGPHATILHRELLDRFRWLDVIVRHEAEEILPDLLSALGGEIGLEGIPGISFRDRDGSITSTSASPIINNLDLLPVPDYDAYPLAELGLEEIRVEAGRGCPFSCTFCSTASFFGRSFRLKSARRLVAEMDMLNTRFGFKMFKLNHDLFTVNRKKVLQFCEAVKGRGYRWSCSARMDCVDSELLASMWAAGCHDVYFGVETGSGRMQELSRKRLELKLVQPILCETQKLSIRSTTSFITGFPEETLADHDATLDQVGATHLHGTGLNRAQLHLLTPEPGTGLIERYGCRLDLDDHVSEFNFPRLSPDDGILLAKHPDIFPNHHHFRTCIPRDRLIFATCLWPALFETARGVLVCLLERHDSRLSRLIGHFYHWACERHPEGVVPDLDLLAAYVQERFGAGDPVVSVARFAAAQVRLSLRRRPRGADPGAMPSVVGLRLSTNAALLLDCHDAPRLLAEVEDRGVSALRHPGPRKDRLLLLTGESLRMFDLHSETAGLLAEFTTVTTFQSACEAFLSRPNAPVPASDDIRKLVDLGILETVPVPERVPA